LKSLNEIFEDDEDSFVLKTKLTHETIKMYVDEFGVFFTKNYENEYTISKQTIVLSIVDDGYDETLELLDTIQQKMLSLSLCYEEKNFSLMKDDTYYLSNTLLLEEEHRIKNMLNELNCTYKKSCTNNKTNYTIVANKDACVEMDIEENDKENKIFFNSNGRANFVICPYFYAGKSTGGKSMQKKKINRKNTKNTKTKSPQFFESTSSVYRCSMEPLPPCHYTKAPTAQSFGASGVQILCKFLHATIPLFNQCAWDGIDNWSNDRKNLCPILGITRAESIPTPWQNMIKNLNHTYEAGRDTKTEKCTEVVAIQHGDVFHQACKVVDELLRKKIPDAFIDGKKISHQRIWNTYSICGHCFSQFMCNLTRVRLKSSPGDTDCFFCEKDDTDWVGTCFGKKIPMEKKKDYKEENGIPSLCYRCLVWGAFHCIFKNSEKKHKH
jgi:hypothetical protein